MRGIKRGRGGGGTLGQMVVCVLGAGELPRTCRQTVHLDSGAPRGLGLVVHSCTIGVHAGGISASL